MYFSKRCLKDFKVKLNEHLVNEADITHGYIIKSNDYIIKNYYFSRFIFAL